MSYPTIKTYSTSISTGSGQTVLSPTSGKTLIIRHITMQNATASVMKAYTGTDGTGTRLIYGSYAANGGQSKDYLNPKRAVAADDILKCDNSAGTAYVTIDYYEE